MKTIVEKYSLLRRGGLFNGTFTFFIRVGAKPEGKHGNCDAVTRQAARQL